MLFWRLDRSFRLSIYFAIVLLFASGAGWLISDQLKEAAETEFWQQAPAYCLMVHGGAAMLTLMLFGALFPLHIGRAWRAKKNRVTGIVMIACNAVLIATAFGLYYLGSEAIRPWASDIHITFGLGLPLLLLVHVKVGRRQAKLTPSRSSTRRGLRSGLASQAPPRS
jgi:cation transport ATPase